MMKRILAGSAAALFLGLLSAAGQAVPMQRLLHRIPVFSSHEYSVVALSRDDDRLMGLNRLIDKSVKGLRGLR